MEVPLDDFEKVQQQKDDAIYARKAAIAAQREQDLASDLAVLKVVVEPVPMPHARFAAVDDLRAGDTVFAMGAPWGLSNSLSAGVVNNPRRLLVSLFEDEADYEGRIDDQFGIGYQRKEPTRRDLVEAIKS